MSILVPFNGSNFIIPTPNEIGWGTNLDNYLVAIANGCLQNIGGSFVLSNDVDFGGTNGLKAVYYKTRSTNIASSGQLRLANAVDSISWRNCANGADLPLAVNSSDQLTFNGIPVAVGGSGTVLPGPANSLAYYPASTNTVDDLPAIAPSRALQSDVNGLPVAASVTATELGYLSGVTSALQSQLNLKAPLSSPTFTGTVTMPSPFTLGTTSVTSTGTELNYVVGLTSSIQTQLNAKASDSLVVHLAGTETITGAKTVAYASWLQSIASSGAQVLNKSTNSSNTASSDALILTEVGGTSAGDASFSSIVASGNSWPWGLDNSDSDAWCITNAATLNGTNLIRATSATGVAIKGDPTGAGVAAGDIGEYLTNNASGNFPSSNVAGDITSLTLTSGDWDVAASANITHGSSDTRYIFAISSVSGNSLTGGGIADGLNLFRFPGSSTQDSAMFVPRYRIQVGSTTTYYLKYFAVYSGSTPQINAYISARRAT